MAEGTLNNYIFQRGRYAVQEVVHGTVTRYYAYEVLCDGEPWRLEFDKNDAITKAKRAAAAEAQGALEL